RYAAGDVAAFQALYDRHEQPLWRFLLRLARNRADAEELMQETWFAVTREAPRFRPDGRFAPWLYSIARNRAIDRHRAARPRLSLDGNRKSTRLNSSHVKISYAVFCLKKNI